MAQPEMITSAANPLLKDVRRAIARGGVTGQGWCVAESFHLLEEALASRCEVKAVVAAESARPGVQARIANLPQVKLVVLPDALFQGVSATEASQGVMALVEPPVWTMEQLFTGCPLVVVLDGLQDPGNAGAIVRAAEYRGRPSPVLKARLNHALELYNRKLAPRIMTTGGAGGDPVYTEGGVGRSYLIGHGVPDEAVITEPNRAGRTMVWPVKTAFGISIRCFMPGSMI